MLKTQDCDTKRKILLKFLTFDFGILLNFSGYIVLLVLQSSINIENGVGSASVTATYITAAVCSLTVTPIILRGLGAKKCGLICELTYLIYILLNFYPAYFTLIPAGLIVGIGEATMWPVMTLYSVYFASKYARCGKKSAKFYATEFVGGFYFAFNNSRVFGNLMNYAILYGSLRSIKTEYGGNSSTTPAIPTVRDLSICGKNDCQDPNVTSENLNRYEPASQTLVYILIGVTAGLVVLAMLIQGFLVESINPSDKDASTPISNDIFKEDKEKQPKLKSRAVYQMMFSTIKSTFFHLISPKQLLLTPFALYSGLVLYLGMGEIPRSFGSCIVNVDQVGLLAALTGGADAIAAILSSKISSKAGRHVTMVIGFCHDIGLYALCSLWVPDESSIWVIYIIFISSGVSDGFWQPLVNDIHRLFFPEKMEIALSVWNMYVLMGVAWQAAWSTSVCLGSRIFFHIGFLCFAICCYGICRHIHKKQNNPENEERKRKINE